VPLSALTLGQHIGEMSPYSNTKIGLSYSYNNNSNPNGRVKELLKEGVLALIFVISTLLVTVVPICGSPERIHLMYSALFGFVGAYMRYTLSKLNPLTPSFPIGTFIANIFGTWVLAVIVVLSKFVVDYHDLPV
jgi:hypothetical protein